MGLIAYVYRDAVLGDCSNRGISSRFDRVCVVNAEGPFEPNEDAPAVAIRPGHGGRGMVHAVPVQETPEGGWETDGHPMMGGAYIATADSRFRQLVEKMTGAPFYGAVPLHDRFE